MTNATKKPVRTRIAPSPTGDPHVGTAYMALFNWAFAKSQGGEFLVRIEDTDQARSTPESEQAIFAALRWLNIPWDEGPDIGGAHGPYRQSERLEIYKRHVKALVDSGHAFHCFCTAERLDAMRLEQRARGETAKYDGQCRSLAPTEVTRRVESGEPHVVRMVVPEQGDCVFNDQLRGEIRIPFTQIDMQVLQKTDGFPTYHLAVVVDDHLMGITHVMRGEEWINSVPKHVLLYQYFGWPLPQYIHLPLLRNPDQSKLSKRKNPTSITYYRDAGYMPEALVNYLGMMGWSMPDEREMFSKEEMCAAFDASRISLGGPVFDVQKLAWLNGQYIRSLDDTAFMDRLADWAFNRDRLSALIPLLKERTERFADIAPRVDYLLGDRRALEKNDLLAVKLSADEVIAVIDHSLRVLDMQRTWERDALFTTLKALADAMNMKLKAFLEPLFIAVSGRQVSLPLFDSMAFLGADVTRIRLRDALGVLEVSGKQAKKLEKSFNGLQLSSSGQDEVEA